MPPMAVPRATGPAGSSTLLASAVRTDTPSAPLTARPGDLAIRRYPFTTAPAVAYVGDLRKVRIIGGQGDWKKVEVATSGQTGWLRLQRYDGAEQTQAGSKPAAPVLREAEAAGQR
ncbi:hypothetical protein ASG43_07985 [Aureimonas sp. Leaf454]|nr:hypothetical protein ASG43_07985 [Aureimonas sp. Leaf454]